MVNDPPRQNDLPIHAPMPERSHCSALVFALVALALVLAIGFFYFTDGSRDDRRADAVMQAADSVDRAASRASDAARNAADSLRQDN